VFPEDVDIPLTSAAQFGRYATPSPLALKWTNWSSWDVQAVPGAFATRGESHDQIGRMRGHGCSEDDGRRHIVGWLARGGIGDPPERHMLAGLCSPLKEASRRRITRAFFDYDESVLKRMLGRASGMSLTSGDYGLSNRSLLRESRAKRSREPRIFSPAIQSCCHQPWWCASCVAAVRNCERRHAAGRHGTS